MKRALISVSDKTGIIDLARALTAARVEILSTGGTAALLVSAGIPVTDVATYTGFPEMLDGRLKTLHPRIHGGLLGRPNRPSDQKAMRAAGIEGIDLLVVNLYPFERASQDPQTSFEAAVEQIDIGGPAMLRSAAKNHNYVIPIVDSSDYEFLIKTLRGETTISPEIRRRLAAKVFAHTSRYDDLIARYLGGEDKEAEDFPDTLRLSFTKRFSMRYGENPHQRAAFYEEPGASVASIAQATKIQGKELSFNNMTDADAALECVRAFVEPACIIVKHANPCGGALGANVREAYEHAYATDPTSAFGGIIAFNRPLDEETASAILERQFVEVIIAPEVSGEAARLLAGKPNIRVLVVTMNRAMHKGLDYRRVSGGLLVQDRDIPEPEVALTLVSQRAPRVSEQRDLIFAWRIAQFVKSNAIVFARGGRTIGIGAGQMSRVDSARVAVFKAQEAGLSVTGTVMASDAYFPFRDGLASAAKAGVTAVIQPGGSVRDPEVIAAACEHDIAMVFTGRRHFRH